MFKLMCAITASVFIIAACSPAQEEVLPTLVTLSDPAESPTTEAPAEAPAEPAAGEADDSLAQTIESETGVTYQLPAGWAVQDNASVSNFASDEDAQVDSISGDSERVNRWMVLGSVGTTTAGNITALGEAASFDEAADLLHEYYYSSQYNIVPPNTYTLANGKTASVSIGLNENRPGWVVAVYFVEGENDTYITIFFESRANTMMEISSLRDAVVESAVLR